MKAKQKAEELFNKYYSYLKANLMHDQEAIEDAKVCALMAVDEVMNFNENIFYINEGSLAWEYFLKVKQEINLL